jgi:predicted Zn-dependent protease with MMP-like domain
MDEDVFSKYVEEAIASLPDEFREKLENVAIIIEDYPNEAQYRKVKSSGGLLLGLYEGIPQTKRGASYGIGGVLPDKITIFRAAIMSIAQTEEELVTSIRGTVLHEIAHHFGMDEQAVRKAEQQRRIKP